MGVYIRGMEMPKACVFCELYDGELYWCRGAKKEIPYSSADERADNCPLVPVPPHGKWERHDDGIMFWWECSECHQDPWYDREELYDYCPSCGAKMEFGESEEE